MRFSHISHPYNLQNKFTISQYLGLTETPAINISIVLRQLKPINLGYAPVRIHRPRALDLKVEGPYIIYHRRGRHHGWRRRAKKILKNTPSRMAKNLLFLCALPKNLNINNNFLIICNLVKMQIFYF